MLLSVTCIGCRQGAKALDEREESREAKALMQGVWIEEESDELFFKMQGDSVYYPDTMSVPSYFRVIDDSLYIGSATGYRIEKQTEYVLWFRNHNGEVVKLKKAVPDSGEEEEFVEKKTPIQPVTQVVKRDTVVFLDGQRYHCYIAINPTRYKVVYNTYNEDGMQVEHVYYDNIIHVSVFKDSHSLFSRDLRKQVYQQHVPDGFLQQAILNDMVFECADQEGFHFSASLCQPDAASCYRVDNIITTDGTLTTKLIE